MSKKNQKKKTIPDQGISGDKQVRHADYDSFSVLRHWSFERIDCNGPWCWSKLGGMDLKDVLIRLGEFEKKTWNELGAIRCHAVELVKLSGQAQSRLSEIMQDDVGSLYSLRINGRQRVWGIQVGDCIKLLWWDPEHEVCPSHKKHT